MLLTLLLDPHLEALGDLYVLVFLLTLVPLLVWRMWQARIDEDLDRDWDEEKQAAAEVARVRRWLLLGALLVVDAALWSAIVR